MLTKTAMVSALEEVDILESTIIMISSDHGGIDFGHGGATDAETHIPWIIAGPGVVAGQNLGPFINTYDSAATIAFLFGIQSPDAWIAKPVLNAFK